MNSGQGAERRQTEGVASGRAGLKPARSRRRPALFQGIFRGDEIRMSDVRFRRVPFCQADVLFSETLLTLKPPTYLCRSLNCHATDVQSSVEISCCFLSLVSRAQQGTDASDQPPVFFYRG
jgi:hypothetical protein